MMDWEVVDGPLEDKKSKGRRNIVEDNVALYAQGKPFFSDNILKK